MELSLDVWVLLHQPEDMRAGELTLVALGGLAGTVLRTLPIGAYKGQLVA